MSAEAFPALPALVALATTAARIATSRCKELAIRAQPGELGCSSCGHVALRAEFRPGRGRSQGEHPDHAYCPACQVSVTYSGYVDGDRMEYLRRARTNQPI